jgi:hypothetical protein
MGSEAPFSSLDQWIKSIPNRHITSKWFGFVDHRPFKSHISGNWYGVFISGAVPAAQVLIGAWTGDKLFKEYSSSSRAGKAGILLGVSLVGAISTLAIAQEAIFVLGLVSKGRVFACHSVNKARYLKAIWLESGQFNWELTIIDYSGGSTPIVDTHVQGSQK